MHIKKMVTWVLSLLLIAPCIIMPETLGTAAANEAEKTGAVNAGAAAESASAGRVGKLTISGNDLSAYTITYATEINDCAKYAAAELQKYLPLLYRTAIWSSPAARDGEICMACMNFWSSM